MMGGRYGWVATNARMTQCGTRQSLKETGDVLLVWMTGLGCQEESFKVVDVVSCLYLQLLKQLLMESTTNGLKKATTSGFVVGERMQWQLECARQQEWERIWR